MACPFAYICILYSQKKYTCNSEPNKCHIIAQHYENITKKTNYSTVNPI